MKSIRVVLSVLLALTLLLSAFPAYASEVIPEDAGADYTVTFSVPAGIAPIPPMTINSEIGATLPVADSPSGYQFLGWTTTAYDNVASEPAQILTGEYKPNSDITLRALYTYRDYGSNPPTILL